MRIAWGVVLFAHGIAHVVGFLGSWRLSESVPYKTTLFGGRLDVGDAGIKVVGVLWLLVALGFALAAFGALARMSGWPALAMAISLVSLAMCLAGWPDARIGVAVDLVLIAALLAARAGWLPGAGG